MRKPKPNTYKMGWCTGFAGEQAHKKCRGKTYSELTKLEYICGCECHTKKGDTK